MLRLLLIYYEPHASGQTTHVLSLARGLDRSRYQVTVVLPDRLRESVTAVRRLGVEVVPLPLRKVLWPPSAILAVSRLIRERKADIVHIHSQEAGLAGRVVAWLCRAPAIVYTPQTIDIRRARLHWLYTSSERMLARVTDVIVSVNERDRRRLIEFGISPHKVLTVPNGIDLARYERPPDAAALRADLGLDADRPLVMQVGRLSAQKDPLVFVDGAAQVLDRCPDVQFALIGGGPMEEVLAGRIQDLGLGGRVHLLGWRDRAYRLLAAADLVTLTSRWEGMPYVLLEAMAWSRPVVATAINGIPEIVADGITGLLAPAANPAAWAEAVLQLLEDPSRAAAMGRRGRLRLEERFTVEQMLGRTEALYESVTAGRGLVSSSR